MRGIEIRAAEARAESEDREVKAGEDDDGSGSGILKSVSRPRPLYSDRPDRLGRKDLYRKKVGSWVGDEAIVSADQVVTKERSRHP